ncbi:hypothetical protein, partial [Paracidobacterium acidisoli]|uniref:hypothetical protein n=1 Tax=Paracidobacterium acidisoli TaxID=2303751 RepID=UPI001C010636
KRNTSFPCPAVKRGLKNPPQNRQPPDSPICTHQVADWRMSRLFVTAIGTIQETVDRSRF